MVHGYPFYISVIVPVGLILLANTVTLVIVMCYLHRHAKEKAMKLSDGNRKTDSAMVVSEIRIAFSCNILLGITWIFALLAIGRATMIFQWLFCVFNSLQGFFIFLFHTLRNEDVRNTWSKKLRKSIPKKTSVKRSNKESTESTRGKWYAIARSSCRPTIYYKETLTYVFHSGIWEIWRTPLWDITLPVMYKANWSTLENHSNIWADFSHDDVIKEKIQWIWVLWVLLVKFK